MNRYSVLIIGAGKISAFFDTPKSPKVLTHAHAFSRHPGFKLSGFVDCNPNASQEAAAVWGGKAFTSIDEAFEHSTIDVVIIATPDQTHFEILKQLSTYDIRLIISEKPLATSLDDAKKIINIYSKTRTPIGINYSRRFIPAYQEIKDKIRSGGFGDFIGGTGWYGKGLLHNGSHLIDLLNFFFKQFDEECSILGMFQDFSPEDPSISALLHIHRHPFYLQAVNQKYFTMFEADLLFENGRLRFIDSGRKLEIYRKTSDPIFPDYHKLVLENTINTQLETAMSSLAKHSWDFLTNKTPLPCTMPDAFQAFITCMMIKKSAGL